MVEPQLFYESKNQKEGEPYLVERDADGKFINNKWALNDVSTSTTQSDWSDDYSDSILININISTTVLPHGFVHVSIRLTVSSHGRGCM